MFSMQNVPNIAPYATTKQNVMNVHKATSLKRMVNVKVSTQLDHLL